MKTQYEVEWIVMTESATRRRDASPDTYEHDHDRDERAVVEVFTSEADALALAHEVVRTYQTVWGHATVTKQQWIDGEWEPVEEPVYVED